MQYVVKKDARSYACACMHMHTHTQFDHLKYRYIKCAFHFSLQLLFEAVISLVFTRCSTWSDNKVRELIAVKLLQSSLLNTTMITLKVLPLGSYASIPAPSPPFKTILELVLWNGLQSCCCITPDVINVIKMPSFQYFVYLQEQKKVIGG